MSTARISGEKGFTLIEFALVVFVLGFVFTLAFPRFASFLSPDPLRADSVRLAEQIRKLRKYAVLSSLPARLNIRPREGTWSAESQDIDGKWNPIRDFPALEGTLIPGNQFQAIRFAGGAEAPGGMVQILFFPSGDAGEAYLTLSDSGKRERIIHIHPTLNRTEIAHGRLENRIR